MIEDDEKAKRYIDDLNNICDECKNEDESVSQNLILTGFKLCKSYKISKLFSYLNMIDRHCIHSTHNE